MRPKLSIFLFTVAFGAELAVSGAGAVGFGDGADGGDIIGGVL